MDRLYVRGECVLKATAELPRLSTLVTGMSL